MTKPWLKALERRSREKKAAQRASLILDSLNAATPPIDPLAIAETESPRLRVVGEDFGDAFDGRLEYDPERRRFLLVYNSKYDVSLEDGSHHPRTRFSIAHELGHYFIDEHLAFLVKKCSSHLSRSEFSSDAMIEREADAFAAGLLMPESLFAPRVNAREPSIDHIRGLANEFNVSRISAAIRSVQLSDFPCSVVGIRDGNVIWTFTSDALIAAKCYPLPKGHPKSLWTQQAWSAYENGEDEIDSVGASPLDWFRSYRSADPQFTVTEEYLAVRSMDLLLVHLTVPEHDLAEPDDDEY